MTEEGSDARLARNTLANGLGTFAGVAISLVLTPFLIVGFGEEAFGVWALALTISFLGGYASLADLGVEGAAARYIAEARSDGDVSAMNRWASTAMAFFGGVALLVTPPLVLLAGPLVDLFHIDPNLRGPARLCFALVAVQLAFELPARIYFAVLEGVQRFTLFQVIELVRAISLAAMFTLALVFDLGIAGLGAGLAASSLIVLVLGRWIAHRAVPELRIRPRFVERRSLRRLMSYGGGLFFIRITSVIYRQVDKAIVGLALGVRFVPVYEIANRIHAGAAMVPSIAASALVPATVFKRWRPELLRELYLRGTMYAVAASLPFSAAAFIFAGPLVRTWVGEGLAEAAGPTRLFLVYLAFIATNIVGVTMVLALGRVRFVASVGGANLLVNLALSIALVGPLGVEGVILGTLIAQALAWPPLVIYFLRVFDVSAAVWVRRVVLTNLPGLAIQAATAAPLLYLANRAPNLAVVGLLAVVSVGMSLTAFMRFGIRGDERRKLVTTIRQAVGLRASA